MGANIIIRGVLGLFFTGLIFLGFMPEIYKFTHSEEMWGEVEDPRAISVRDVIWTMFLATGMIAFFAIFAWMINASTRKTAHSTYE